MFRGRHVEQQIGLDQGPIGLVIKHNLLVGVRVDEFVFEIAVELLRHLELGLVLLGEDRLEMYVGDVLVIFRLLGALLREAFRSDEMRVGIGLVPFGEEDVVLEIGGGHVRDAVSESLEFARDGGREGDWGEDGELTGCETDCLGEGLVFICWEHVKKRGNTNCSSTTEFDQTKSQERYRKGRDIRCQVTENHDFLWIRRN